MRRHTEEEELNFKWKMRRTAWLTKPSYIIDYHVFRRLGLHCQFTQHTYRWFGLIVRIVYISGVSRW